MTNTVFSPGDSTFDEMIGETSHGILLEGRHMGQADSTGEFMFGVGEGIEIKNGELGKPFRAVTVSGVVFEVLKQVSMVSKESCLGFSGLCGKFQTAFTGGGGPYLKTRLHIGGTTN